VSAEQVPAQSTVPYAIRMTVTDDLVRSRATVFFRLILAIPHLIFLVLWGFAAAVVLVIDWIWTLIAGQSPQWAHDFLGAFVRYSVHVAAYISMAAEPYPGFVGAPGYPVDVAIDPPAPQRRVITVFRFILAIPILIIAGALQNVQFAVALVSWFYILATGRMHEGMRNLITFCIAINARVTGYTYFLTDRYPPLSEGRIPTS
jgi:Domain of unknown function (DUF4389)